MHLIKPEEFISFDIMGMMKALGSEYRIRYVCMPTGVGSERRDTHFIYRYTNGDKLAAIEFSKDVCYVAAHNGAKHSCPRNSKLMPTELVSIIVEAECEDSEGNIVIDVKDIAIERWVVYALIRAFTWLQLPETYRQSPFLGFGHRDFSV